MRILFIEDDVMIGELSCEFMVRRGHKFTWVKDMNSALDALMQSKVDNNLYDLIITDYHFPGGNGDKVAKVARELYQYRNIYLHSGTPLDADPNLYTGVLDKTNPQELKGLLSNGQK